MCIFLLNIKHLLNEKHILLLLENISVIESFYNNCNNLEDLLDGEDLKQCLLNKVDIILKLLCQKYFIFPCYHIHIYNIELSYFNINVHLLYQVRQDTHIYYSYLGTEIYQIVPKIFICV